MARPKNIKPGPGRPKGRLNNVTRKRQFTIRELILKGFKGGQEGLIRHACKAAEAGDAQVLKLLLAYVWGAPPQEVKFSGTKEQPLVLKIVRENGANGHGNGGGGS